MLVRIFFVCVSLLVSCGLLVAPFEDVEYSTTIAYLSSKDWSIYSMDIETRKTQRITGDVEGGVRWSPDGTMIAYTGSKARGSSAPSGPICVMKRDGSGKRVVTFWNHKGTIEPHPDGGIDPVWSPDGSRIAFSRRGEWYNSEIYIVDIDTTGGFREERVTSNPYSDHASDWSPDGSKILFQSDLALDGSYDNYGDWYTVNPDGTEKTRIAVYSSAFGLDNLRYSPDGQLIACRGGSGNTELYIMNADGSDMKKITGNNITESQLSWSPDGKRLVFTARSPNDGHHAGGGDLYVINIDGTGLKRLTNDGFTYYYPDWKPR